MIIRMEDLKGPKLEQAKQSCQGKDFIIIVHPHFTRHNTTLDNFLKSEESEKSAIFIGEEHGLRSKTEEWLRRAHPNRHVITYSTASRLANPIMGWQRFLKKLELLGGTKTTIQVGGNNIRNKSVEAARITIEALLALKQLRMPILEAKIKKSIQRTLIRAGKNQKTNIVTTKCAGFTASKIAARGKFNVKVTRRFTH